MSDIRERLNYWADIQAGGSELRAVMREAVAEIDRLRSVAGKVSDGPDLSTIRNDLRPASATTVDWRSI